MPLSKCRVCSGQFRDLYGHMWVAHSEPLIEELEAALANHFEAAGYAEHAEWCTRPCDCGRDALGRNKTKETFYQRMKALRARLAEVEEALRTAYEDAAKAAESELLEDPQPGEDVVYQQAIKDAVVAIRALKREVGG